MRTRANNPAGRPGPRVSGFTLIEMLIIISIILLLASILLPSLYAGLAQARTTESFAILDTIERGCSFYKDDFREYPPSSKNSTPTGWITGSNNYGRHCLVQYLTGYSDADLKTGYGFRTVQRGADHGPYGDTERLNTSKYTPSAFVDAFNREVIYYRFNASTGKYSWGDNDDAIKHTTSPDGTDRMQNLDEYATRTNGTFYRRDIMLMTSGADGKWKAIRAGDTDDITNLRK